MGKDYSPHTRTARAARAVILGDSVSRVEGSGFGPFLLGLNACTEKGLCPLPDDPLSCRVARDT